MREKKHHFSKACKKTFGSVFPCFHKRHQNQQDHPAPAAVSINHHNPHSTYARPTPPNRAKPILDHCEVDDNVFSDYINRAKITMRAVSNVGGGGGEETESRVDINVADKKEDDGEDEFSSYINRAKLRIRKTSSIGSRNLISFKRD